MNAKYYLQNDCSLAVKIFKIHKTVYNISVKAHKGKKKEWIIKNFHCTITNPNILVGTIGDKFLIRISELDSDCLEIQFETVCGSIMIFYGDTQTSQIFKI